MVLSSRKREGGDGAPRRGRIALIVSLAVVAVLLAAAAAGMVYVGSVETIFPNVRVDGLDIGGLTLNETAQFLTEHGYAAMGDATVTAELPENITLAVRADEVCSETPVSEIALMAYDTCKGNSSVADALTYLRCLFGGIDLDSKSALSVDETAVRARVEAAAKDLQLALLDSEMRIGETEISIRKGASGITVDTEALTARIVKAFQDHAYEPFRYEAEIHEDKELDVQALYDTVYAERADAVYTEAHEIQPEVVGVSFDLEEARRLWDSAAYGEDVRIPLILDRPEVTAADLEALLFRDRLSTMTTSLWGSTQNRINNVEKAAGSINGVILMPDEEFSYNPTLGERTAANGYKLAGAYSGGQVTQEYGGGICQVSSTLYYCSLYANLKISARSCHYFPVGYLPAGLDATVSWGGPEFKFINNREYPIEIRAGVDRESNSVTVEIWGTDVDGSYVQMTYATQLVYDKEHEEVAVGYKAQTYRSVFSADGTLLSRKEEANSYYHYHDEDIEWPEESPEVTETPPATETPLPTETPPAAETPVPPETPTVPPAQTPPVETTPVPDAAPSPDVPPAETPVPTAPAEATT